MNTNLPLNFIAIDFETATIKEQMPCQIGITLVEDGVIKESFSRYIQPPENKYSKRCINVHHITPTITEDEPLFPDVWNDIKHYFVNSIIVAHNASFDIRVLENAMNYYNLPTPNISGYYCTYDMTGEKLDVACHMYGINLGNHHDAKFDSIACAKLYLSIANNIKPVNKKMEPQHTQQGFLFSDDDFAESHPKLKGDILKKDLSLAKDTNHPFYDRKVVITGVFTQDRKELANYLKNCGADINTNISKHTDFVLIGKDPGYKKIEKIDALRMDGFDVRRIYQEDLDKIISNHHEGYHVEKGARKELDLTYDHYLAHNAAVTDDMNPIYGKELYFSNSKEKGFALFAQLTGNFGASGDSFLCVETNLCVLTDSTIETLKKGEKDETCRYIEEYYNNTKAEKFDYTFISVSDILSFCKKRIDATNDTISGALYDKYIKETNSIS